LIGPLKKWVLFYHRTLESKNMLLHMPTQRVVTNTKDVSSHGG